MTRKTWPRYASLAEDEKFRKEHWNDLLNDCNGRARIIMHGMSNLLPIDQLSDTELNCVTYSGYYGGNCAKGGVFTQICG
mmetsp:Transcript_20164/g.23365  ORF Transcript_20164/g.23365 Transcript_20164/m.23365 type:complete len:80 (-) Transcript_20164:316-555(-)